MPPIILASTSPFRAQLLSRIGLDFQAFAPDIDETPLENEEPDAMVKRLTATKARAAQPHFDCGLVIASDQCAVCEGQIIGKPANHDAAVEQLRSFSGKTIDFLTGLTLLNLESGQQQADIVPFSVSFRDLSTAQIEHYLHKEQPYQCAGSFKSEALGITLFRQMSGDDPNALIGLPLIRLTDFLLNEGVDLP